MIEQILQADRHLQVDQVARARDIYSRVVEMDPANAIAVVGLARCALADGDDQKAHGLSSRALEIDPENDMARRMEARLSEILATRGETVERPEAAASDSPREMRPVITDDSPARGSTSAGPATMTPTAAPRQAMPAISQATAAPNPTMPSPRPTAAVPSQAMPVPSQAMGAPRQAMPAPPRPMARPGPMTPAPPRIPKPTTTSPIHAAKEPAVRKSLLYRLLGR